MSSPVSKYEAAGIFLSVAIMAVALALLSVRSDRGVLSERAGDTEQGAVVVVSEEGESEEANLADALIDASADNGELQALVVDDVKIGTGAAAEVGDTVVVHYIGSTRDGIQFDSSYERGAPFIFTLGDEKVIAGWEAGVPGMQIGGQRILVIPPDMGYGSRQVGPIPPDTILVFAIELLSIDPE